MFIPSQYNYGQNYYYPQMPAANNNSYKPKTSVDSVRIDIVNPKASLEPSAQTTNSSISSPQYGYPNYYPQYYYPQYYPYGYPNNGQNIYNNYNPHINQNTTVPPAPQPPVQPQPPAQQTQPQPQPQPPTQQPQNQPPQQQPPAAKPLNENQNKPPVDKKIGTVPEAFIKQIDEALSSPNPQVRINAGAKLAEYFEKNPDAVNNPALNVLVNRTLKDPHQNVRLMGEIAIKVGANGNPETKTILNGMKTSTKAFGEDAIAANSLLADLATRDTYIQNPDIQKQQQELALAQQEYNNQRPWQQPEAQQTEALTQQQQPQEQLNNNIATNMNTQNQSINTNQPTVPPIIPDQPVLDTNIAAVGPQQNNSMYQTATTQSGQNVAMNPHVVNQQQPSRLNMVA
jgi:hypothetical protein